MKTLWNILAVIAVANLIAIGGFVGWLRMSGRLDMDRAIATRKAFTPTIAQVKEEEAKKAKDAEAAKKQAEEEAKASRTPLTAAEKLAARIEATEVDRQRMDRLKREIEDLQKAIARERGEVDASRAKLTAEQKDFDEQVRQAAALASTEQFQKTLGILQSVKPAAAKQMLKEMLAGAAANGGGSAPSSQAGAPGAGSAPGSASTDAQFGANGQASVDGKPAAQAGDAQQGARSAAESAKRVAVEYLNAMDERARTKVMSEFVKDDPKLAAELLEALRLRGQFARADAGQAP